MLAEAVLAWFLIAEILLTRNNINEPMNVFAINQKSINDSCCST
jgi:hypothetical protein